MRTFGSHPSRFILAAFIRGAATADPGHRNFILHNWGNSQDGKTATLWPRCLYGAIPTDSWVVRHHPHGHGAKAALHSDLPLAVNEREVLINSKNRISTRSCTSWVRGAAAAGERKQGSRTWPHGVLLCCPQARAHCQPADPSRGHDQGAGNL
jgi:hypothetical protein